MHDATSPPTFVKLVVEVKELAAAQTIFLIVFSLYISDMTSVPCLCVCPAECLANGSCLPVCVCVCVSARPGVWASGNLSVWWTPRSFLLLMTSLFSQPPPLGPPSPLPAHNITSSSGNKRTIFIDNDLPLTETRRDMKSSLFSSTSHRRPTLARFISSHRHTFPCM